MSKNLTVHNIEIGIRNGRLLLDTFVHRFGFELHAVRETDVCKQWVVTNGKAVFLITEIDFPEAFDNAIPESFLLKIREDPYIANWNQETMKTYQGSVFGIAFSMNNFKTDGFDVLVPSCILHDEEGFVTYSKMKSCIGNVVHTLIDPQSYTGIFLPGFKKPTSPPDLQVDIDVSHFDHVTFVCEPGDSARIIKWYSQMFGMKRLLINRKEDDVEGCIIAEGNMGLRLKAFEFWKCSEVAISFPEMSTTPKPIFVIAESLPGQSSNNQVDTFLREHGGPGIQHVALHTDNIVRTVTNMAGNGVQFTEPPRTYYSEVRKRSGMKINANLNLLEEQGILIDTDDEIPDGPPSGLGTNQCGDDTQERGQTSRYLMQKFTRPIFDKKTFFLEIIQREGATGFGSGNILALWRSVEALLKPQKLDV